MKRKVSVSHGGAIVRRIRREPEFGVAYLKAALEEEDEPRVLLMALRHLAQAQGIARVAKAAGIERASLYRALSVRGNASSVYALRGHQGHWVATHRRGCAIARDAHREDLPLRNPEGSIG
jgi:probable addiction module antidote protein